MTGEASGNKRRGVTASAIIAVAIGFVLAAPQASAAITSVVLDPTGDVRFNAPAYQDIVKVVVSETDGTFTLTMDVAGQVPASPAIPPPANNQIWWAWCFDVNSQTFPEGFPFPPGLPVLCEYVIVGLAWDGASFSAMLIDRTPLLSGGTAIITPIGFTVSGSEVTTSFNAALVGNPSGFMWQSATIDWAGPPGSLGEHFADAAPATFTAWPS